MQLTSVSSGALHTPSPQQFVVFDGVHQLEGVTHSFSRKLRPRPLPLPRRASVAAAHPSRSTTVSIDRPTTSIVGAPRDDIAIGRSCGGWDTWRPLQKGGLFEPQPLQGCRCEHVFTLAAIDPSCHGAWCTGMAICDP